MNNMVNRKETGVITESHKGICDCGESITVEAIWYIDARHLSALQRLEVGLENLVQYACKPSKALEGGATAVWIDCPEQEIGLIAIPKSLAYRALSLQADLMKKIANEESLSAKSYYHTPELVVGDHSLAARLEALSSDYRINARPDPTPHPRAPKIGGLPQRLQAPQTVQNELAQELAESQTQVIRGKREESGRGATGEVKITSGVSALDALIDSALDHTQDLTSIAPQKVSESAERSQSTTVSKTANIEATAVTDSTPVEDLSAQKKPQEPTKLLYAQNMKQFDTEAAQGDDHYIRITDGSIELASKVDERRAESWITDDLDIRVQLHRELQLGAPCIVLFTLKDGVQQDELYWPIHIDNTVGPKVLRSLRKSFKLELTLYKKSGKFYGQRMIEAPLEENAAYIINYIKQMGMTSSGAAKARAVVAAEDFDRDGQMKHPFNQESFSEISSAQEAMIAVSIWSYWSTVRQRDYLIFIKSFPIPWLRRLQHRVLKSAIEFGIHMPLNIQGQAVALGLAKSDVELLQRCITHFVEVNVNFRVSRLSAAETWENWDGLLSQMSEMGIDADEEVEQLAFQAMQRAGVDAEFEDDEPTNAQEFESLESIEAQEILAASGEDEIFEQSFDDLSDISEINDIESDIPPPIDRVMGVDEDDIELISEDFIEEEYLTDAGGEIFLLIDDVDIIEEDVIDPVTAAAGAQITQMNSVIDLELKTQVFVSSPQDSADSDDSESRERSTKES